MKKRLKDLFKDDKPREKLIKKGAKSLKDKELIAILLSSGMKDKDVLSLSEEVKSVIKKKNNDIALDDLLKIRGLGIAKASKIIAAFELVKRYLVKDDEENYIRGPKDVYELLKKFTKEKQEHFIVITLDGANKVIDINVAFKGTLNKSIIHPREIFADALTQRAASIIVAHNHPSGNLEPSDDDIKITETLIKAGEILGINILDHLIISKKGYYSIVEKRGYNE